jgi:ABC-2 type transport system permease protein
MILHLLRHESALLQRDRRLFVLLGVVGALLLGAGWVGHISTEGQREARLQAVENSRAQWEGLGDYNPHSAAHFGTYAFKPVGGLAALDPGIDAYLGNVLRLEGHVQNEPGFSQASLSGSLLRFGSLTPALVLQVLLPLLLVFGAFSSVAGDRESGRLRLLLVQGAGPARLLFTKALVWWLVAVVVLTAALVATGVFGLVSGEPADPARLAAFGAAHAVWFAVIALGAVAVSGVARDGRGALVALLLIWLGWTVLLPRVTGEIADSLHPLPTRVAFEAAKDADRAQGLDGHNPADARRAALEERVLAEYGVERVEDLPINFDGIALQADEEYGNQVWDRHFGAVREVMDRQQGVLRAASLLDPYLAIRSLSARIAGTDLGASLTFQEQAEAYRRNLIETLNREHAYGGSAYQEWSWTADASFYRGIEDFAYTPPELSHSLAGAVPEAAVLAFWLLGLIGLTATAGRRLRAI